MAYKLMFFVQVFGMDRKNRLVGGVSFEMDSEEAAIAKARRLSEKNVGAVAFSQMVDKAAGDCEDATILVHFGLVPDDARAA